MFGAMTWEKELDLRQGEVVEPRIAFQRIVCLPGRERHVGFLFVEG